MRGSDDFLEYGPQVEALLDLSGGVFTAEEGLIEVVDPGVQSGDIGSEFLSEGSEILSEGSHFLSERSHVLPLDAKERD